MPVDLDLSKGLLIGLAGAAAGFINAIVGSGTLLSFPTLIGVGYESVPANMANSIGLTPGSLSAAHGYRRELAGQKERLLRFAPASASGALIGALLVLVLPPSYFKRIVPFLVLVGVVLVLLQPRTQRRLRARIAASEAAGTAPPAGSREHISRRVQFGVFLTGVYGGYFGAGQGVILTGMLGSALVDDLQRINATKNVLAAIANGVASVVFILRGGVPWWPAAIIAGASIIGAQFGALIGRRIPPNVLRAVIVIVGLFVAIRLFLS